MQNLAIWSALMKPRPSKETKSEHLNFLFNAH